MISKIFVCGNLEHDKKKNFEIVYNTLLEFCRENNERFDDPVLPNVKVIINTEERIIDPIIDWCVINWCQHTIVDSSPSNIDFEDIENTWKPDAYIVFSNEELYNMLVKMGKNVTFV